MWDYREVIANIFCRGSSVTASVSIATLNLPSHASPSSLGASDGKKDSLTPPQQMTSLAPPHGLQIPSVTVTAVHGPHPAASASVAVASASSYTMTPAIPIPEINDNAGNEIFAETLDRNKDGLSPSLRNAFMNASPEGINNLLDSFNQQHGQKSLTRKYAAHSVVKDFLDVAGGFLKILGMFVQYCPDITPLILGGLTTFVQVGLDILPVRPILTSYVQIGTRYADFFEMMSDAVEKLRDELKFLSLYAKLYSDYPAVKKVCIPSTRPEVWPPTCTSIGSLHCLCRYHRILQTFLWDIHGQGFKPRQ